MNLVYFCIGYCFVCFRQSRFLIFTLVIIDFCFNDLLARLGRFMLRFQILIDFSSRFCSIFFMSSYCCRCSFLNYFRIMRRFTICVSHHIGFIIWKHIIGVYLNKLQIQQWIGLTGLRCLGTTILYIISVHEFTVYIFPRYMLCAQFISALPEYALILLALKIWVHFRFQCIFFQIYLSILTFVAGLHEFTICTLTSNCTLNQP